MRGTRAININSLGGELPNEVIPHFVDLVEKQLPSDFGAQYRVVFSSPNPARHKEILKESYATGFVQPPWSLEEVLEAYARIKKYRENISKDDVLRQYNLYGGIVRYCLEKIAENGRDLRKAMSRKAERILELVVLFTWDMKDDDVSYLILHMYSEDTVNYSFSYSYLVPASQWIVDELEKLDIKLLDARNAAYLRWRQSPFEAASGYIFETFCKKLLPCMSHQINQLGSNLSREIRIKSSEVEPLSRDLHWTPILDRIYFFAKSNNESSDAFMISKSRELLIFQLTRGKRHTIKMKGLENLLVRLAGNYQSSSYIFVSPENFRLRTIQSLTDINDKVSENFPPMIKKYKIQSNQWVLLLKFPLFGDLNENNDA